MAPVALGFKYVSAARPSLVNWNQSTYKIKCSAKSCHECDIDHFSSKYNIFGMHADALFRGIPVLLM